MMGRIAGGMAAGLVLPEPLRACSSLSGFWAR